MYFGRYIIVLIMAFPLFAGVSNLRLSTAIEILKKDNLELKISRFNEQMAKYEAEATEAMNYGKLDLTVTGMRSNDAGNVFGFKLQSREATFGDFGAEEFMNNFGACANSGNMQACQDMYNKPPSELNYPKARNHYQTKISYMLPLYTGGKLTEYKNITESLHIMSQYDSKKLLNAKIYQVKKAFYDISLVDNYIYNLSKIMKNINKLVNVIQNMKTEGYAKDIDLLEVQARKAETLSMYNQAKLNRDLAYQFLSFLLNQKVTSIQKVKEMARMPRVDLQNLLSNNIDIQKALLGLEISKMAVEVQEGSFRPEIGAFGEYGSANNNMLHDFFDKDSYTVGIQAKWNLFSGGADKARLEKAKVNRLMVEEQVRLAKTGIALKVKKLRTEILSADADIRSYQQQLNFFKKVYENYRERYAEGMVSISDVLVKQSKQLEIMLKLLTAKNKRNTKIFELDSILNRGDRV
ncbi:Type I secretion system, outer membrane component LapE [hydrothermal vent metagenome]|uniref:Type I secretion system, outer membrane component LapE n=1 Tax=hydrothermal vent metagenome TaxID=652676 RepID=A0A1W1ECY2_9ZZZZ